MAKKSMEEGFEPEWSYLVDSEEIEGKPLEIKAEAGKEEKRALARRLGVISLESLSVDALFSRKKGSLVIHVKGTLRAELTQECVVTTDPVQSTTEEEFEGWFADPEQAVSFAKARQDKLQEKGQNELPVLREQEDPEPITDGQIDLGELVAQHLSLSINPYPHAEGVHYELGDDEIKAQPAESRQNPFAALKDWKEKQKDDKS